MFVCVVFFVFHSARTPFTLLHVSTMLIWVIVSFVSLCLSQRFGWAFVTVFLFFKKE